MRKMYDDWILKDLMFIFDSVGPVTEHVDTTVKRIWRAYIMRTWRSALIRMGGAVFWSPLVRNELATPAAPFFTLYNYNWALLYIASHARRKRRVKACLADATGNALKAWVFCFAQSCAQCKQCVYSCVDAQCSDWNALRTRASFMYEFFFS